MCHHFRRLSLWDSWAVTSWTVLFSYRGREAARNGITNSSVLTSASCACLYACVCMCMCVYGHTLCDGCRGFCQPSGYFFEFQETMIMFILDTCFLKISKNSQNRPSGYMTACYFFCCCFCQACLLLSLLFPPAMGTWRQFNLNHSALSLATSPVFPCLPGSEPGLTVNTAGFVQVNKLWPISQLPLANSYRL